MFYFVTITRNGEKFYVISPNYGAYNLAPSKVMNTYLWTSEESARSDERWRYLIRPGDVIEYNRNYSS